MSLGASCGRLRLPTIPEAVFEQVENRVKVRLTPRPSLQSSSLMISADSTRGLSVVLGVAQFYGTFLADLPHFLAWAAKREQSSVSTKRKLDELFSGLIDLPRMERSDDLLFAFAQSTPIRAGLVLAASVWIGTQKIRGALVVGEQRSSRKQFASEFYFETGRTIPALPPTGSVTLSRRIYTGPQARWTSDLDSASGPAFAEFLITAK